MGISLSLCQYGLEKIRRVGKWVMARGLGLINQMSVMDPSLLARKSSGQPLRNFKFSAGGFGEGKSACCVKNVPVYSKLKNSRSGYR